MRSAVLACVSTSAAAAADLAEVAFYVDTYLQSLEAQDVVDWFAVLVAFPVSVAVGFWNLFLRRTMRRNSQSEQSLRRQLDQLAQARNAAEAASQAKSAFVAMMSHEMRTPVNAIAGTLELALERGRLGDWESESLRNAHQSARILLDMIGDTLDLERIEAGRMELCEQPCSPRSLVESAARMFDATARSRGVPLRLHLDAAQDMQVMLDPLRFRQILVNLIGNALKFTERGVVSVVLRVHPRDDTGAWIELRVIDTGVGISNAEQGGLFQPYAQARGQRGRDGSGLGLYITRKLVESMGGSIELHSEPGLGTELVLALSARRAPGQAARLDGESAHGAPGPLQILVVDDDDASRRLLAHQLQHLGHRVVEASGAAQACGLWRSGAYHLVITDCIMAGMNGDELAARLRAAELRHGARHRCAIWGYSADASQLRFASGSGNSQRPPGPLFDRRLLKPLTLDRLRELLRKREVREAVLHDAWRGGLKFDPGVLVHLTLGDRSVCRQLLDRLRHANRRDLAALEQVAAQCDRRAAGAVAHAIRGVARIIDAPGLTRACVRLEECAGAATSDEVLCAAAAETATELRAVQRSLDAWSEEGYQL
jgi:signal transduction histidine kinase/HPt (histidine-containing phosphotransfer) domain-containing protein